MQQPTSDHKVSVAMSSVAVVEPSSAYMPQKWYNSDLTKQGPVKAGTVEDDELPQQSKYSFSKDKDDKNVVNDSPASMPVQNDEVQVSSSVSFPNQAQDKKEEKVQTQNANLNPANRPMEDHLIVSNQSDGSTKEVMQSGTTTLDGETVVSSNIPGNIQNGINNIQSNLPQLSEALTPPVESRPLLR